MGEKKNTIEILINELKCTCSTQLKTGLKYIQQAQREDKRIIRRRQELKKQERETVRFELRKGIVFKKGNDRYKIYLSRNMVEKGMSSGTRIH